MILAVFPAGMLAAPPVLPTTIDSASKLALSGMVPVVVIVFVILGLLVVWAVFVRHSPRDPRARRLSDAPPPSGRRRRHRRREHRPRPPSLAETGGLPPIKPAEPPNPPA